VQVSDGTSVAVETFAVTVADINGPIVTQVERNAGDGRYDQLTSLAFTFSEDISGSLNPSDLVIVDADTGRVIDTSGAAVAWSPSTMAARWFLNQVDLGIGRYEVSIRASGITDAAGNPLDGNGDGTAGDNYMREEVVTFAGDADLDLVVDFRDFVALANNFGSTSATWGEGDFLGDRTVDFSDFVALANNFGQQHPAAAAAASAAFAEADGEDDDDWWLATGDADEDLL
jgi:hypothetical protein